MTSIPISDEPVDVEMDDTQLEAAIPVPVGYHLLIVMPDVTDTFESGILKAETTKHHESILSMVGLVLDMGGDCYQDKRKFPAGPWCKAGDFVMFRANSGTRFRVDGKEYRLLNDDSIEAVVKEPSKITSI